jgi:hypothetical protein
LLHICILERSHCGETFCENFRVILPFLGPRKRVFLVAFKNIYCMVFVFGRCAPWYATVALLLYYQNSLEIASQSLSDLDKKEHFYFLHNFLK